MLTPLRRLLMSEWSRRGYFDVKRVFLKTDFLKLRITFSEYYPVDFFKIYKGYAKKPFLLCYESFMKEKIL